MEHGCALSELIAVMAQETELYEDLLELAGRKKDVLIEHRIEELKQIVHRESEILKRLGKMELRRAPLLAALAPSEGDIGSPELSAILPTLDSPEREELNRIKERLQRTVGEISARNAVNQKLIETQLQYTSFCIELMTGNHESEGPCGYSANINHPRPLAFSLLDQKV
ncbi:MAG: flagellar protein FlgN [Bacillota bacterium]